MGMCCLDAGLLLLFDIFCLVICVYVLVFVVIPYFLLLTFTLHSERDKRLVRECVCLSVCLGDIFELSINYSLNLES